MNWPLTGFAEGGCCLERKREGRCPIRSVLVGGIIELRIKIGVFSYLEIVSLSISIIYLCLLSE